MLKALAGAKTVTFVLLVGLVLSLAALIAGVVGPLFCLRAYLALNCIFLLMGLVLWLRSMRGQSSLQPGAST